MMELVHMTVEYSNVVLLAVLPCVTDFAARLDLPIERPIAPAQVIWSQASPYKVYVEAGLVLKNHDWFAVNHRGFVEGFRTPTNWFFEQEFTDESARKYFGADHMTTNDAIRMAREVVSRIGYTPEISHSHETPRVEGPFDSERLRQHIPYCRVVWEWPKVKGLSLADENYIQVEFNTETKTLVGFHLVFSRTNNITSKPLSVSVVPELESDYRKRVAQSSRGMFIRTNAPMHFPGRENQSR